jgi:hypothetical protein
MVQDSWKRLLRAGSDHSILSKNRDAILIVSSSPKPGIQNRKAPGQAGALRLAVATGRFHLAKAAVAFAHRASRNAVKRSISE